MTHPLGTPRTRGLLRRVTLRTQKRSTRKNLTKAFAVKTKPNGKDRTLHGKDRIRARREANR